MKLTTTRSLLRPSSFFRRRRRRSGGRPFFTGIGRRRGGAAAENPEPSSPKVTCIGQVRVKSQKRVNQCRRRINGEASFRSAEPSFQQQRSRRSRRDQQRSWLHLPSISVVLRALGHEFCCLFRCCTCSYSERRERGGEREKMKRSGSTGCFADESGRGELFGRWLVAVNGCDGGGRREIEVVVGGGGDEEAAAAAEMLSAGNSRRHVFDDIEVIGDRIEVKGRSFVDGEGGGGVSVSIPPKNALLLMRCRSDPIKMAAIANRISSDAVRYENGGAIRKQEEEEEEEEEEDDDQSLEGEDKIFVARVLEQEKEMLNAGENGCNEEEEKEEEIEKQFNEEEDEEEEEEVESNMSSFEALLEQENTEIYQDCPIQDDPRLVEAKSEESTKSDADKKISTNNDDDNRDPSTVEESDKQEKNAAPLPENQEAVAAAATLPDCLLLMMREPKLSMEVSKETWVCATDFIRLLPERPRRAAAKAAGDHEPAIRRRAAVEKSNKPRVPPPPSRKNDVQPARSSCSLPAATAGPERKRVDGDACEPLALTRCKSEPMSTAAAKLMPESGCWKENVGMQLEPHRQASLGVGAAGVGF